MINSLGFMQGRLTTVVDGKIQAFPKDHWREEFPLANSINVTKMEWTLDQDRLYENPLMTIRGRNQIRQLSRKWLLDIPSLTGDCFMQAPFWKAKTASSADALKRDFLAILEVCGELRIKTIVVPIVDNGKIETSCEEDRLVDYLSSLSSLLAEKKVSVAFESDFPPEDLQRFIARFESSMFGINYDTGNSAALGYNPAVEIECYGDRILNVHIKDRLRGGNTVPLGTGSADIPNVLSLLKACGYSGNFILQTARALDNSHVATIDRYVKMMNGWLYAA